MVINDQEIYDGSLLHKRFAYRYFRDEVSPTGNIIGFVSPMDVTLNLIDLEDSLNNDYIYSASAINLLWEIPNLCPIGAIAFQRLFNTLIAARLSEYIKTPITMKGDDMMVSAFGETKKASVSIAYSKDNVALGHTGINIDAGDKAPIFAYSTRLSRADAYAFMGDSFKIFKDLTKDINIAASKISL